MARVVLCYLIDVPKARSHWLLLVATCVSCSKAKAPITGDIRLQKNTHCIDELYRQASISGEAIN